MLGLVYQDSDLVPTHNPLLHTTTESLAVPGVLRGTEAQAFPRGHTQGRRPGVA